MAALLARPTRRCSPALLSPLLRSICTGPTQSTAAVATESVASTPDVGAAQVPKIPLMMKTTLLRKKLLKSYAVSKRGASELLGSSLSSSSGTEQASERARQKEMADLRRDYARKTSDLRKGYAADIQKKTEQLRKIEEEERRKIDEQKAIRAVAKKERAAARAIEVAEEEKALQAVLKEQRAVSAQHRARMEGRQGYIRFKRMEEVRRQSSMWIEEANLERRIQEALANPYHLAGSSGSEPIDRDDSYYEDPDEA